MKFLRFLAQCAHNTIKGPHTHTHTHTHRQTKRFKSRDDSQHSHRSHDKHLLAPRPIRPLCQGQQYRHCISLTDFTLVESDTVRNTITVHTVAKCLSQPVASQLRRWLYTPITMLLSSAQFYTPLIQVTSSDTV